MATINPYVHKDLESFLKKVETDVKAKAYYDVSSWSRAETPTRIFSAFPVVKMTSVGTLPAGGVTPGQNSLYDGNIHPTTFRQFMLDFQKAIDSGKVFDSIVATRTKLKPYVSLDIKFAPPPPIGITAKTAPTGKVVGDTATITQLFTLSNLTASQVTVTANNGATVSGTTVTLVNAGATKVTAVAKSDSSVKAEVTIQVAEAPTP